MTRTPKPSNGRQTAALEPEGSTTVTTRDTDRPVPRLEEQFDEPTEANAVFDGLVEEIRRRLGSNSFLLFPRLEDMIRRRLGLAPMSPGATALGGLTAVGIRLALALLATALFGRWEAIPWSRWAPIFAFYGLLDATQPFRTPPLDAAPGPRIRQMVDDWTALLPSIVRESDLRELAAFTRRWVRLPVTSAVGGAVAAAMLASCWAFAPDAFGDLPAGSIVLLALLLCDFGAAATSPIDWAMMARQSRYDHHLFWPSPADSPQVQRQMRMVMLMGASTGMWITFYLVLTVVLVSWGSPLVLPLAVAFIAIGYAFTIVSAVGVRTAIQKIVQRARRQRLDGLQNRIDAFGPIYADLSPEESEHVRGLIELHNMIRDAPATPTTTHTLMHAVAGLIVPTITFVIAVFGEVSAERILDAILP